MLSDSFDSDQDNLGPNCLHGMMYAVIWGVMS